MLPLLPAKAAYCCRSLCCCAFVLATAVTAVLLQLSDDWEPTIGWDDDILRALREGGGQRGVGLDEEWVLQVVPVVFLHRAT